MAKARASKGLLVEPAHRATHSAADRDSWLKAARDGFVARTPANRIIYGWLLERLWPAGHGIPGPVVKETELRRHIDAHRAARGKGSYKDIFRRVRELQGDEGFTSIRKEGVRYQLQSLDTSAKRPPRGNPPPELWQRLKAAAGNRCANCGKQEPDVQLSPDHRTPLPINARPLLTDPACTILGF